MRVLVTGGAGFIGSKVATHLLNRGHQLLLCDNMATGCRTNIDPRARFIEVGAESPKLHQEMKSFGVEAVAHIGGNSSGEMGEIDPLSDIRWNVESTLNLLHAAEKLKIRRFVYASSMGVYGQPSEGQKLCEVDSGRPISVYGTGKLCSEAYLAAFASRGIGCIALRMFNVYGPGQNMANPRQGMVSNYMDQLLRGPKVIVRGSLERILDFVYIDDVVRGWELAIERSGLVDGFHAVNISTGVGSKVSEVLELMGEYAGGIEIEIQGATPADQRAVIGDNALARKFLGWQPQFAVAEGLRNMWDWAVCQKNSH